MTNVKIQDLNSRGHGCSIWLSSTKRMGACSGIGTILGSFMKIPSDHVQKAPGGMKLSFV